MTWLKYNPQQYQSYILIVSPQCQKHEQSSWNLIFYFFYSIFNWDSKLCLSFLVLMAKILGCFLYLIIGFKIRWVMFLSEGSFLVNSTIFRFLAALEKNIFKIFAFFHLQKWFYPLSTNEILSEDFILSDNTYFTVLQNCFLSLTSFSFKLKKIIPINFLQ